MGSAHPAGYAYPYLTNSLLAASRGLLKRAFALEYRLLRAKPFTPEIGFPAPLLDALAGYHYLLHTLGFTPTNIIVEGDSAGAHLAVALLRALAQMQSPHLPQLGGAFFISPTPDRAGTHGPPPRANYASDWLQPFLGHDLVQRVLIGALPKAALTDVWLSPASKTIRDPARFFGGFPATLIAAGAAELLILPMRTLRDRIEEGSGKGSVTYREYEDAMHDWVAFEWCEPQRSQALDDFGKWLEGLYHV
jgi:acetyl esterase/lipase